MSRPAAIARFKTWPGFFDWTPFALVRPALPTEQIEALRVRMSDTHGDEMTLVTRLAAELAERDAALMRELDAVLVAHERRRADIVHALHTLAARIGHVPMGRVEHGQPVPAPAPLGQQALVH